MREARRSAIVPHSAERMFALVADVAAYPEFLPGCTRGQVLRDEGAETTASLSLSRGPFDATFTTRNTLVPPRQLTMELIDGPFKALHGQWTFTPLGDAGCRADLTVRFEFRSRAVDLLMGPAFERLCNEIVDAFVQRAASVYGSGD
jgi:ribosome-associated toxin RatA of RatAB toxin-antitoxin module